MLLSQWGNKCYSVFYQKELQLHQVPWNLCACKMHKLIIIKQRSNYQESSKRHICLGKDTGKCQASTWLYYWNEHISFLTLRTLFKWIWRERYEPSDDNNVLQTISKGCSENLLFKAWWVFVFPNCNAID